jgi:cobalt-precorrin-5B (C1)-methyltransferase
VAGEGSDFEVEISVPDGEKMAERTLNPRLGILGGISILGTTGIVIPYSCSSWIHSIHRGIDVARAMGFTHVSGATGNASENAARDFHKLHEVQLIDMGDFAGGMLKYVRDHPVPRVTIAGGVAKMTKLAQGMLDLHSKRGAADLEALAAVALQASASEALAEKIRGANTVAEAFSEATADGIPIGQAIADGAWRTAAAVLKDPEIELEILIFNREGELMGHKPFAATGSGQYQQP